MLKLDQVLKKQQEDQADLSPEMRQYGYDLFGLNQFDGNEAPIEVPFAPDAEQEDMTERSPASISPIEEQPISKPQQIQPMAAPQPTREQPIEAQPIDQQPIQAEQPTDIDRLLKQTKEQEDRAEYYKELAKVRDAAMGVGIGRIPAQTDLSTYEAMSKRAKKPLENLLLKQELEDKQSKNDPNSNISKLIRKSLQDLGMSMDGLEGVSYSQLEKLYPSLTQGLYTKIAAEARKEEAQERRAERADLKLDKLDQQKQKELVKHIDYSVNNLKKAYEGYSKSQTTLDAISNILGSAKNKITPGTADVTMLYSFISSLDPASTVREGEIALSKSAMSLWGKIKQGTAQLTGGDLLDSDTRKSIEEIMKSVQAARQNQFAKQKANLIESGVGKGLDKDMLNAYIYPEVDASSALKKKISPTEDETVKFSKSYKPGSVITLKDGSSYIVQEDGVTGVKK